MRLHFAVRRQLESFNRGDNRMWIRCVPSRRLSFLAAEFGVLASIAWLVLTIVLNQPSLWAAGGAPVLLRGVLFHLRTKRISAGPSHSN
jgi:hypothetical protein